MRRILLASAAILAIAGGPALAAGSGSKTTSGTTASEVYQQADADKDGTISQTEATTYAAAKFGEMDKNKDGFLDKSEVAAKADMKGQPTGTKPGSQAGMNPNTPGGSDQSYHGMMKSADKDNDGKVSRAEFDAAAMDHFKAADADKDGKVTAAEFNKEAATGQ